MITGVCEHEFGFSGYCLKCGAFGFDAHRLFFKEGVKMSNPYGWGRETDSIPLDHIHEYNTLGFCKKCGYSPPGQQDDPYAELGKRIGRMVAEKQLAYGDSFGRAGQVLKILYPNGIILNQYDDMLAVVRIIDKLFRIANDKDAFGESPFRDICGYGLLGASKEISK